MLVRKQVGITKPWTCITGIPCIPDLAYCYTWCIYKWSPTYTKWWKNLQFPMNYVRSQRLKVLSENMQLTHEINPSSFNSIPSSCCVGVLKRLQANSHGAAALVLWPGSVPGVPTKYQGCWIWPTKTGELTNKDMTNRLLYLPYRSCTGLGFDHQKHVNVIFFNCHWCSKQHNSS